MNVNSAMQSQIASVQQALGMMSLQQSMGQDGATVGKLLEGMQETTEAVQQAAGINRGHHLNVRA
ncbi:hypothetical protein HSACCH_02331 [Halanaerobium saccharolyticum subsp. saccharolyticum DSM 6643]|jgi:hypothetical protein|uniref:Uncharacterized protein n=1 Tax=Halanaerobium saccharolyticum subsp. saccharolyticum DSM 6643 TaxID=1293054 RepID=M5E2R2_9FIRM|nr:hypothetical protein [Halanaerobium saccharolyticum]CCU80815.1 hypothetical protein HSACCH_02331 [Halanaerobium saccharolyticum subsp. saccharolyticum DSM 6643]